VTWAGAKSEMYIAKKGILMLRRVDQWHLEATGGEYTRLRKVIKVGRYVHRKAM
jgi:hypothetical protein